MQQLGGDINKNVLDQGSPLAFKKKTYLRKIPVDPITNSADTWETVPAEADPANPSSEPGIYNIKSGAPGTSLEGMAYAEF